MIALVGSLAASLVCLGLLNTLVGQVRLMVPHGATPDERQAVRAAHKVWQSDLQIRNTIAQLNILQTRNPTDDELATWSSVSRDNSLPVWAELLVRLREAEIEPARPESTQPSEATIARAQDEAILHPSFVSARRLA